MSADEQCVVCAVERVERPDISTPEDQCDEIELVPLRAGLDAGAAPWFIVPPPGLEPLHLLSLAEALSGHAPVYALRLTDAAPVVAIEDLAKRCVAAMRRADRTKPYRLLGHSIGALVAYEMANQLLGVDAPVAFLGLIDCYRPKNDPHAERHPAEIAALAGYLQYLLVPSVAYDPHSLDTAHDPQSLLEHYERAGLLSTLLHRARALRWQSRCTDALDAAWTYCPPPLSIPVHLFNPAAVGGASGFDGWNELLGAGLRAEPVIVAGGRAFDHTNVAPLVAPLNAAIDEAAATRTPRCPELAYLPALALQVGKPGAATLFCVPGAGANVTSFIPLVMALGVEDAIYGLQPRGLDGLLAPHATVSAAASAYVAAIRNTAARGPYRLVGHSFGGWIVLEMARQLTEMGEHVEPLVLLDTQCPTGRRRIRHYMRVAVLGKLIATLEQVSGKRLELPRAVLEQLDYESQLLKLTQRMKSAGLLARTARLETVCAMVRVFAANLNTMYAPRGQYDGHLLFIRPAERSTLASEDGDSDEDEQWDDAAMRLCWQRHALSVEVVTLPANHMTLLKPPNAEMLAQHLRRVWQIPRREGVKHDRC